MISDAMYSPDAEKAVLGSCLVDPSAFGLICDMLTADDFYSRANAIVWQALVSLAEAGTPADIITIAARLKSSRQLASVGGAEYLDDLSEGVASSAHVTAYAQLVAKMAVNRRLQAAGYAIGRIAADDTLEPLTKIDQAEAAIFGAGGRDGQGQLLPASDGIGGILAQAREQSRLGRPSGGLMVGIRELDKMTAGLHPASLIIVGARPSMGKTAFALTLALNVALAPKPGIVAVFSLEMSYEDILRRMMCARAGINSIEMQSGKLHSRELHQAEEAARELTAAPVYISDKGGTTVLEMKGKLRRLKARRGLDLVIIDYLQLIHGSGRSESRVQEISQISRQLKEMAKELQVPVIALSQLSRALESRADKRPCLSDLRESGAIEQDADLVAFLYRDEYYNKKSMDRDIAELIIAKHRNGPVGGFKMRFTKKYGSFADLPSAEDVWAGIVPLPKKKQPAEDWGDIPRLDSIGDLPI